MLGEKILGQDASYLRRLGALCATLCGAAALLGAVPLALAPDAAVVAAVVLSAALAACGALLARR